MHANSRHALAQARQAQEAPVDLALADDYFPEQLAGIASPGAARGSEALRLAPDLQGAGAGAQEYAAVARLPQPAVPGYHELGVRIAWQALPAAGLALAGCKLLHAHRPVSGMAGPRHLAERHALAGATLCS